MGYLLYDHGDSRWSTYFKVLEVLAVVSGIRSVFQETKSGSGLPYSKFAGEISRKEIKVVPSGFGMCIIYAPAALVASWIFADNLLLRTAADSELTASSSVGGLKVLVLSAALCAHFVKRVSETLFLHAYSGQTGLSTALTISFHYLTSVVNMNWSQQISQQLAPPAVDLTWVGVVVFFTGVLGNLYHHLLLKDLRRGGDRRYVVPEGGLFGIFVAPHYIFEMVTFAGLSLIAQTWYTAAGFIFVLFYLTSRCYMTKLWYLKKMDRFPRNRCVLIPYVF